MKELLKFTTDRSVEDVLDLLKANTYPTAGEFRTLPFGPHYFSGTVSGKGIRIRNARRFGRVEGISPILNITVQSVNHQTEITIHDDTEEETRTNYLIILVICLCMSVTVLIVGIVGVFAAPQDFSLPWVIIISLVCAVPSFFVKAATQWSVKINGDSDLAYIVHLLKR